MAVAQHASGADQPSVAVTRARRESRIRGLRVREAGSRTRPVASRCWARRSAPIDRRSSETAPANGFGFRGRGGLTADVGQ
jgi:hypothetical protein